MLIVDIAYSLIVRSGTIVSTLSAASVRSQA